MKTRLQAIRLAILMEAFSLPVFFVETYHKVSMLLMDWFFTLNFPTILLFRWMVWERHGGKVTFSVVVIFIIAIQSVIWFFVWVGLLKVFKKISSKGGIKHLAVFLLFAGWGGLCAATYLFRWEYWPHWSLVFGYALLGIGAWLSRHRESQFVLASACLICLVNCVLFIGSQACHFMFGFSDRVMTLDSAIPLFTFCVAFPSFAVLAARRLRDHIHRRRFGRI